MENRKDRNLYYKSSRTAIQKKHTIETQKEEPQKKKAKMERKG